MSRPPPVPAKAALVTLIKSTTVTETQTASFTAHTTLTHHSTVTISSCAHDAPSQLSHIVIPLAFKEAQLVKLVRGLRYWQDHPPCLREAQPSTRLLFLLAQTPTAGELTRLYEIYDSLGPRIHVCFKEWTVVSANVPHYKDNHFDGSRAMLEALIDNTLQLPDLQYIFWMEPDTIPIRSNWLPALQQAVEGEPFWVKGSALRHSLDSLKLERRYGRHFLYHINGNALYNMAREQFPQFYRRQLLPYLEAVGSTTFAFDLALEKFLTDERNYAVWQATAHRFHYTQLVQNRWRVTLDFDEFAQAFPHTFLVHGALPHVAPAS